MPLHEPSVGKLSLFIDGGATLYRAWCPEFAVTYYGENREAARAGVHDLVKNEAAAILKLNGAGSEQGPRRTLAEAVARTNGNLAALFDEHS